MQQRLSQLEEQLLDNTIYEDSNRDNLKQILQEQGETKTQLEKDEASWLELNDELETF